jgi:ABC-type Mn2+/Zn2+ transport system ATPase subunit
MSGAILTAHGLTVRYGDVAALEALDVEIPRGAAVAVLGPNGSGKSTLFAAAVGLVDPAAGTIAAATARIAYLPQQVGVDPIFPATVADVVRMGRWSGLGVRRRTSARDRALVAGAMRALGVDHLARRRLGELSGGQRQRTLLAQVAAQDAELLLLDEPFTGVDTPTEGTVRELIHAWRDEGRTVLVATHDLARAARDYDLVLALNRRLIAFGPAAATCTEDVLAATFAGHVARVGGLLIETEHRHPGAA